MDQYEYVRIAYRVYGKNISEISRETGHSRNTVKKAIREESWGYKERKHQPFPVLEPYLKIIDDWLKNDKKEPKKQRHTARRIFNRLVKEHDYKGGESTVRRYVKMAKITLGIDVPKAFIPCDPEAGYEAEVDWGSAKAIISGKEVRLKFFCMRSKYSGKHFVRFYLCERQQAFFDAHIHAINFFGGIFPVLIYDNLTTAVQKVLKGKNRLEQEEFTKFKAYYNFESRFCNPNSGHEKGGVEGLVRFARRNYMVPIPEANNLEELNDKILKQCLIYGNHKIAGREYKVEELYEQEKQHLISLPLAPFSNIQTCDSRVDKYSTAIIDHNRYSVPWKYTGYKVKVLLRVNTIEIFHGNKKIAIHERLFNSNRWSLVPDHYLELIQQRPMAFESARPIRQWRPQWPECLNLLLQCFCKAQGKTKGIKDFISVLMLYRDYSAVDVETAVELALENMVNTSDGVQHILIYTDEILPTTKPLENWSSFSPPDIAVYNQLGGAI